MRYTSKGFRNGMAVRRSLLHDIAVFIHEFGRPDGSGGHSFAGMEFGGGGTHVFRSSTQTTFSITQDDGLFGRGADDCHCSYLSIEELTMVHDAFRAFKGLFSERLQVNPMAACIAETLGGGRQDMDIPLPSGLLVSEAYPGGYVQVGRFGSVPDTMMGLARPMYLSGTVHVNRLSLPDLLVLLVAVRGGGDTCAVKEMRRRLKAAGLLPEGWDVRSVRRPDDGIQAALEGDGGKGCLLTFDMAGRLTGWEGSVPVEAVGDACRIF